MSAIIDRFAREYLEFHRVTKGRCVEHLKVLRRFEDTLDGDLPTATAADFSAFASDLLGEGLHINTVRKKMVMLRATFSWMWAVRLIDAERYLELKSVRNPRGSTGRTKPRPYSRAELQQFWRALDRKLPLLPTGGQRGRGSRVLERWLVGKTPWARVWRHAMSLQVRAVVALALHCGLRSGEIRTLTPDELHYENEYIVVRGKRDPRTGEIQVRTVPFTMEARKAVKAWLDMRTLMRPEHDVTWLSCFGQSWVYPMRIERWKQLLHQTVGAGWELHRFRHTCATEWLRAGVDLAEVQQLLGHSTLQQTLAYALIAKEDVAVSMARHEDKFNEAVMPSAA